MPRIALGIEYDGACFHGWQSQPGGATVQDVLETAISSVALETVRTICAGRTDAGVHAAGQVVHFDTAARRPLQAWVRGVNAHLGAHVAVTGAQEVPDTFNARYSATGRRYRYLLLNRPQRPGLLAGRAGWHFRPLDVPAMVEATAHLIGRHDFSAFRAAECQAKSPVRDLRALSISRSADMVIFDLAADGFLHHMVRNIVGSLVYVGDGRRPPDWLADVLTRRERRLAAPTFDAAGLYLVGVDYDPSWNLKVSLGGTASLFPHP